MAAPRLFLPRLESFRGVAALVVATGHTVGVLLPSAEAQPVMQLLGRIFNGHAAVLVFFVLSGYVLGLSLDRPSPSGFGAQYATYVFRRLFRIYPAFLLSVLLALAYLGWHRVEAGFPAASPWFNQWYRQFPAPGAWRGILSFQDIQLNNVAWTLRSEMIGSLLLPFFHRIQRRSGWGINGVMLVGLLLLARHLNNQFVANLPLFYLGLTVPGMLASRALQRLPSACLGVALLGCAILTTQITVPLDHSWIGLVPMLGAFGLVVLVALERRSLFHWFLDLPAIRFYGRISYSLYLLHFLGLHALAVTALQWLPGAWIATHTLLLTLGLLLLSVTLVTPIAYLAWRWIELPGMELGRRMTQWGRSAAPHPPVA